VINVTNRVPAEVFLWHPQWRQLHGNTPTKQRQSRNFKSLNIIMSTKLELLISDIIVGSYHKCSNCCPFTRTQARRRLLHSSITSSTTVCYRPDQTSPRPGAASVDPHLSPASGIHDAVHGPKCSSRQHRGRGCWLASGLAG